MKNPKRLKTVLVSVIVSVVCLGIVSSVVVYTVKRKTLTVIDANKNSFTTDKNSLNEIEIISESADETEDAEESETESESTASTSATAASTTVKPTAASTTAPATSAVTATQPSATESASSAQPASAANGSHSISGELPAGARVSPSYFDDVVFVGDSISEMLKIYNSSAKSLGGAKFLTSESLSATNALWDVSRKNAVHPKYNGKKQKVEDSIAQIGAKKVYIMLGINDISSVGVGNGIKNFETLCNCILAKSPNVKIYVQSVTPIAETSTLKISNATVSDYNSRLAALCGRRGWYFVNVASVMYNDRGYLRTDYCSDAKKMGIHFNNTGCKAWIEYLYTHTA